MMTAICAYATPILRYTFGIIKWTRAELQKLDVKTRKLLTTHGFYHPKLSIPHLCLHCTHRGRGITGVETTHDCECSALVKYILESTGTLTQIVRDTPTMTQKFLMKFASRPKHTDPNAVDNDHHQALLAKPMHGKFFTQQGEVPGVDLDQSHMWLCQAGLHGEVEAALCTAQDQTMATNYIRHKICKEAVNLLCCLCGKHNEIIPHIASSCDMLLGTKYVEHHNKVCRYLHWCILQDKGQTVAPNWHQHKADKTPSICLGVGHTLMYNMIQRVDRAISANHPDLVVLNKEKRTALLFDVTCPMDISMVTAAAKKHKKYCNLEIAMKKQYKLCKIQAVPIVIGALGTLCQNFDTNLTKVSPRTCVATIQKEVLL
eukprot:3100488-Ditylum_brightwellii.AAC.1